MEPQMDDLSKLKQHLKEYRDVDDKIRTLNEQLNGLREKRKTNELILTELLSHPKFVGFDKLKLEDDGSTIRIQRPQHWNKPWVLPKSTLHTYLQQYFATTAGPTADSCFAYIEQQQKRALVSNEFSLTRLLGKDVWKQ
jgi:hypothetical protein